MSKWTEFRDEAERIIAYGARLFFPIVATVAAPLGLPAWVGVVAGSIVPQLMGIAERNFPAKGSGPMRKTQVLTATQEIIAILEKTFTGGAKVNFDSIRPTLEKLIDQTVAAANELAPKIIGNDPLPGPPTQGSGIAAPIDSP